MFLAIADAASGDELLHSPALPRHPVLERLLRHGGPPDGTLRVEGGMSVRWRLIEFTPRDHPPADLPPFMRGPLPPRPPLPGQDAPLDESQPFVDRRAPPPEPFPSTASSLPPPRLRLLLGRDVSPLVTDLDHLALALAGLCAAATVMALGLSYWLRAQILKPVDQLGEAIRAIDPTGSEARLDDAAVPAELAVLIHRLNEMFARVEQAFVREKRTIADIVHELRTPLAGLRTTLEFAQLAATPPEPALLTRCLGITLTMQRVIEDLLAIARLESGHEQPERTPCRPLKVLDDVADELLPMLAARGLTLEWRKRSDVTIRSDARRLRLVFANLLGNAAHHAPALSVIETEVKIDGSEALITFTNVCTEMTAADAERVFIPFWRRDQVRTGGSGHAGLGLALCQRLVRLLGGSITAEIGDGRFTISVRLPIQPAPMPLAAPA